MIFRHALIPFLLGIGGGETAAASKETGADHDAKDVRDDSTIIADNGDENTDLKKKTKHVNPQKIKLMEMKKKLQSIHSSSNTLRNRNQDAADSGEEPRNYDGASFYDAKEDADTVDSGLLRNRDRRNLEVDCASICGDDRPVVAAMNDYEFEELIRTCVKNDNSDCGMPTDTPIGCWDVSRITDMTYAFGFRKAFNEPLECWDVSRVTKMDSMFYKAESFNQPIGNWDVSNVNVVYGMYQMMDAAYEFDQDLNDWDVSNVKDMQAMFYGCKKFNCPLKDWDVSEVVYMSTMFEEASMFNQDIDDWNVSGVLSMEGMFSMAADFNQDLNSWNVNRVKEMTSMFSNALDFNQCVSSWASKTPDDVVIDGIFNATSCPGSCVRISNLTDCPDYEEPNPMVGPWCQGLEQGCTAEGLIRTPNPTPPPTNQVVTESPTEVLVEASVTTLVAPNQPSIQTTDDLNDALVAASNAALTPVLRRSRRLLERNLETSGCDVDASSTVIDCTTDHFTQEQIDNANFCADAAIVVTSPDESCDLGLAAGIIWADAQSSIGNIQSDVGPTTGATLFLGDEPFSPTRPPSPPPTFPPTPPPTEAAPMATLPPQLPTRPPIATPPTRSPLRPNRPTRPTAKPTATPTNSPTKKPVATSSPSKSPTASPTEKPTLVPTGSPTSEPTVSPTDSPTGKPTLVPTGSPTSKPTVSPTQSPSDPPTLSPTKKVVTESPTEVLVEASVTTLVAPNQPSIQTTDDLNDALVAASNAALTFSRRLLERNLVTSGCDVDASSTVIDCSTDHFTQEEIDNANFCADAAIVLTSPDASCDLGVAAGIIWADAMSSIGNIQSNVGPTTGSTLFLGDEPFTPTRPPTSPPTLPPTPPPIASTSNPSGTPTLVRDNVPCETAEDCTSDQYCGEKGMCMDDGTCMMDSECDVGEACKYLGLGYTGDMGFCVPIAPSPSASPTSVGDNVPCETAEDCTSDQYCGEKGMCMDDGTCMMDSECDVGEACEYLGFGYTGDMGFCVPIQTTLDPTQSPTKGPKGCKNMKSADGNGFLVQTLPKKKNRFIRLKCSQIKKDGHCNKKAKHHGKIKKAKVLCRSSCDNCKKKKPKPPTDAPVEPTKAPTKPKKCKDSGDKDKKYTLRLDKKKRKRTCKQIEKQNLCNKKLIDLDGNPPAKKKCKKSCGVCGKEDNIFVP